MVSATSDSRQQWATLVALEPRLARLEEQCCSYRGGRRLDYWYRSVKPQLVVLVGYHRRVITGDEILGSIWAYDLAYDHLLATLTRPRRASAERRGRAA